MNILHYTTYWTRVLSADNTPGRTIEALRTRTGTLTSAQPLSSTITTSGTVIDDSVVR